MGRKSKKTPAPGEKSPRAARRALLRTWTPRLLLLAMGIALLAATHSFIPVGAVSKDRSIPFPCQDRPCGCANYAECWRNCCCYSDKEKILWAVENDAPIPAEVLDRLLKEAGDNAAVGGKSPADRPSNKSIANPYSESSSKNTCCEGKRPSPLDSAKPCSKGCRCHRQKTKKSELVYGLFARHCQGDENYSSLSLTLMVFPKVTFQLDHPPSPIPLSMECEHPFGQRLTPPLPPPELV